MSQPARKPRSASALPSPADIVRAIPRPAGIDDVEQRVEKHRLERDALTLAAENARGGRGVQVIPTRDALRIADLQRKNAEALTAAREELETTVAEYKR